MFSFMRGHLFGSPLFVFEGETGGGGGSGGGNGGGSGGGGNENMVPQSRFSEVTNERNAEKTRADELQRKLDEKEQEGATELQKAVARAEKAERERDDLKGTVTTMKRDNALRSAVPAEVIDADAVTALLAGGAYGQIDSDKPETITAAIDALKNAKPGLFVKADGTPPAPQNFGGGGGTGGGNNGGGQQQQQQGEPASERESMGRGIMTMLRGG